MREIDEGTRQVVDYNNAIMEHIEQLTAATEQVSTYTSVVAEASEDNKDMVENAKNVMDSIMDNVERLVSYI